MWSIKERGNRHSHIVAKFYYLSQAVKLTLYSSLININPSGLVYTGIFYCKQ